MKQMKHQDGFMIVFLLSKLNLGDYLLLQFEFSSCTVQQLKQHQIDKFLFNKLNFLLNNVCKTPRERSEAIVVKYFLI